MTDMEFELPWDAPEQRYFVTYPFLPYFCWHRDAAFPKNLETNVVAVTGPGTAYDGEHIVLFADLDVDTILIIEIADSETHWMEPGDLDIRQIPKSITRGVEGDGVHVGFADGRVWFLRADTPLEELKKFFTIEGAKQYDREQVLGPYVISRSK